MSADLIVPETTVNSRPPTSTCVRTIICRASKKSISAFAKPVSPTLHLSRYYETIITEEVWCRVGSLKLSTIDGKPSWGR